MLFYCIFSQSGRKSTKIIFTMQISSQKFEVFCVRRMRFELTHRNRHYPLKVACLPIPPPALINHSFQILETLIHYINVCAQNRTRTCTAINHSHLKRARLPIPPPGLQENKATACRPLLFNSLSKLRAEDGTRTRDPNLGKVMLYQLSYFRICGCKYNVFFCTNNEFAKKNQSKKKQKDYF